MQIGVCIYFAVQLLYFLSFYIQKVGIPEENDINIMTGGALSECGGCTTDFTLVQKEETLALASSPWHLTAFVSKFIKTEMESVGRAAARRWFSCTQKKTNSAKAQKL